MSNRYNGLKIILLKKNIKQEELADKINLPRATLNVKINRYNNRDFTLEEAKKISEIIKEPIESFF
ncbi:transcriptional regulator [Eggerthia catenaformis]|nr:transcriptional regulator [Eggerthia catenaformis]